MHNNHFEKYFTEVTNTSIAQLVEQRVANLKDRGSNLTLIYIFFLIFLRILWQKKIFSTYFFLLKTFTIMVVEAQKPVIIWTCAWKLFEWKYPKLAIVGDLSGSIASKFNAQIILLQENKLWKFEFNTSIVVSSRGSEIKSPRDHLWIGFATV